MRVYELLVLGLFRLVELPSQETFGGCLTPSPLNVLFCISDRRSHSFLWEQANAAQFGGIGYRPLTNLPDGTMDLRAVSGVNCFLCLTSFAPEC